MSRQNQSLDLPLGHNIEDEGSHRNTVLHFPLLIYSFIALPTQQILLAQEVSQGMLQLYNLTSRLIKWVKCALKENDFDVR